MFEIPWVRGQTFSFCTQLYSAFCHSRASCWVLLAPLLWSIGEIDVFMVSDEGDGREKWYLESKSCDKLVGGSDVLLLDLYTIDFMLVCIKET